ncbi:MAG: formimidoylglutamase [Bacteroidetes bacterium]|jgi:formiminoglutamase|nr:formimidoylglutamase [Bacteroidota bacterium]
MNHLVVYTKEEILNETRIRENETKIGENVQVLPSKGNTLLEKLKHSTARYIVLGIPEDIGVRANSGRGGAYSAWKPALFSLLNVQSNAFGDGSNILVLGHIAFDDLMLAADSINFRTKKGLDKARKLVQQVDERVIPVIRDIIQSGKEAIIIGGGHNNSYPNIRGAAEGLHKAGKVKKAAINCINSDAHSDFREMEGRHSGNGFRYAFEEGYLKNYSIVGLHESYNAGNVLDAMTSQKKRISLSFFEDIFIRENITFKEAVQRAIDNVKNEYCGIEIDMDTIQNIPASARTSSGLSTIEARKYVTWAAQNLKACYFHIAEAAPVLSHIKTDNKSGKLIGYLIADYIKARNSASSKLQ